MFRLSEALAGLRSGEPDVRQWGDDVVVGAVASDSRQLRAGSLFVALAGERFDGHDHVEAAFAAGAAAALVDASQAGRWPGRPLLAVRDSRAALGALAAWWRRRLALPVVAVTGSNGKTTVKEMVAAVGRQALGEDGVLATRGNRNNEIGLPLTLLELRPEHRLAVVEMGMNHAGEIARLTRIAAPDVALVNNAQAAHLAGLGSVHAVARAKGEIFEGLAASGWALYNADDAFARLWAGLAGEHQRLGFGLEHGDVRGGLGDDGRVWAETPLGALHYHLPLPGAHNIANSLAAVAVAVAMGWPGAAVEAGLQGFFGVPGRLCRLPEREGLRIIDDSYNANPGSVAAAIRVLAGEPAPRILVLGDMAELGEAAVRLHEDIGRLARQSGLDGLWSVGELAGRAAAAFGDGGQVFADHAALAAALRQRAPASVLVKGSRSSGMERVIACLGGEERPCC